MPPVTVWYATHTVSCAAVPSFVFAADVTGRLTETVCPGLRPEVSVFHGIVLVPAAAVPPPVHVNPLSICIKPDVVWFAKSTHAVAHDPNCSPKAIVARPVEWIYVGFWHKNQDRAMHAFDIAEGVVFQIKTLLKNINIITTSVPCMINL